MVNTQCCAYPREKTAISDQSTKLEVTLKRLLNLKRSFYD